MMNNDWLSKDTTTAMKGFAILLVIIAHVGHDGFGIRPFVPLGCFGVAIFLILSGYGLMESYHRNGLTGFWKKRLLRILTPYLIWVGFYSLYRVLLHQPLPLGHIRYWFVEYIILWYISFYFVLRFSPKYKWPVMLVIAFLLFWFNSCLQAQQSLSFLIGIWISENKERIINTKPKTLLLIGCSFLIIGVFAFGIRQWFMIIDNGIPITEIKDLFTTQGADNDDFTRKLISLFSKTPIALFLIALMNYIHVGKSRWAYTIGIVAYELYLVHMPFYPYICNSWFNLLVFIVETIIFTYLLYVCDKMVMKQISKPRK